MKTFPKYLATAQDFINVIRDAPADGSWDGRIDHALANLKASAERSEIVWPEGWEEMKEEERQGALKAGPLPTKVVAEPTGKIYRLGWDVPMVEALEAGIQKGREARIIKEAAGLIGSGRVEDLNTAAVSLISGIESYQNLKRVLDDQTMESEAKKTQSEQIQVRLCDDLLALSVSKNKNFEAAIEKTLAGKQEVQ